MSNASFKILAVGTTMLDSIGVRKQFKERGFPCTVTTIVDSAQLVSDSSIPSGEYDLVFADLTTGNHSDLENIKKDRALTSRIPLVGMFEQGNSDLIADTLEAGMEAFLEKDPQDEFMALVPVFLRRQVERGRDVKTRERMTAWVGRLEREKSALTGACLTLITHHDLESKIVWSNAIDVQDDPSFDQLLFYSVSAIQNNHHKYLHHIHLFAESQTIHLQEKLLQQELFSH